MAQPPARPHVVIIMADQLRYDVLGGPLTPNLNQLRDEGVAFTRAYCASPICAPSRGSFFTGRYPNQTGCLLNPWEHQDRAYGQVKHGTPNLYQLLETGWDSWHTGKQHFFSQDSLDARPASRTHWLTLEKGYGPFLKAHGKRPPGGAAFQAILPEQVGGRTTRPRAYSIPTIGRYEPGFDYFFDGYILNTSLDALRRRDRSKPFLLNAMFLAPHPPLDIPEPWFSKVKTTELPTNVDRWSGNQSPLQLYNITGYFGTRYRRDDWQKIWPVYLGLVNLLDHAVGQLIAELKAQGIYDDTLILFTSDHGEMLGSHRLWQKMCMYEESARVPLFIKFPKRFQPKITTSEALVSQIDVLPTLCEYLGVAVPAGVEGASLLPLVGGKPGGRERVFVQYDGNGARGNFQRCVVEGDDKLIVDFFKDEVFLELYRVGQDPQELTSLAFEKQEEPRVRALLESLRTHMRRTGDALTIPADAYETFIRQYSPFKVSK